MEDSPKVAPASSKKSLRTVSNTPSQSDPRTEKLEEKLQAAPSARPATKPEAEAEAIPEPDAIVEAPSLDEEKVSDSPLFVTALDPDLELILKALSHLAPVPHEAAFRHFVSGVKRDRAQERILRMSDGDLVLGGRTGFDSYDESKFFIYLSALYSVFNRQQAGVEDTDERVFHSLILARCDSLFGRSLGP